MKFRRVEAFCLLLILLITIGAAAPPILSSAKIDPEVTAQLRLGEQVTAVVLLDSTADLTRAAALGDWSQRGTAVYVALGAHADRSQAGVRALLRSLAARDPRLTWEPHWIVNAISVTGNRAVFDALAALPEVAQIVPPPQLAVDLPTAARQSDPPTELPWGLTRVRADAIWQQYGITGQGVTVGSLDSGAEYTHPALNAAYRGNLGKGQYTHDYNWLDFKYSLSVTPLDGWGHGTHTIGTMLGRATETATAVGVAPDANWIAVAACDRYGCGSLIKAGEWLLAPYPTSRDESLADPSRRPQVVNNSWGQFFGPLYDPFYKPITDAWRAAGMIPVFAAGNNGYVANSVHSPADYCEVLAVASSDSSDMRSSFSSFGPGDHPDCRDKPDVIAPGEQIVSAFPGGGYYSWQGTSMAAPHVAGCIALLLELDPALDYETIWTLLTTNAVELGTDGFDPYYGYGRLDCYAAAHALTFMAAWPAQQSVCVGQPAIWDVRAIRGDGAPFDVSFTASGAPAGAIVQFGTNPLTAGLPATTTLTIDNLTAAGSHAITITGAAPTRTAQTVRQLRVFEQLPEQAAGLTPAEGAVNVGRRPLLQWQASAADQYFVEIAADPLFASLVYTATATTNEHRVIVPLEIGPTYHWRVTPTNACGGGLTSQPAAFVAETPVIYVAQAARAGGNGAGWETAFSDLQAALAVADSGSEIWLAAGNYSPGPNPGDTFWLPHGAALYGGFSGDETQRDERNPDPFSNGSVLDGHGVFRPVMRLASTGGGPPSRVDGLTVRGGYHYQPDGGGNEEGGGIYAPNTTAELHNLLITDNRASRYGGGIYATGTLTMSQVSLIANHADESGGGAYLGNTIGHTLRFERNTVVFTGGGLRSAGNIALTNVLFYGNQSAGSGGGLTTFWPLTVTNGAFVGNSANSVTQYGGGGLFIGWDDTHLTNVTFTRNRSREPGGAILETGEQWSGHGPSVRNAIFWANAPDDIFKRSSGVFAIADTLLANGCPNYTTCSGVLPATNPRFAVAPQPGPDAVWGTLDDDYGDLHPQAISPARDVGVVAHLPQDLHDLDSDGNYAERLPVDAALGARWVGTSVDLGAFECQTCGVPAAASIRQVTALEPVGRHWYAVILLSITLLLLATRLYWRHVKRE